MKHLLMLLAALSLFGCSSVTLQPADFSWPVESILKADGNGMVAESRYAVSFSINEMMKKEFKDTQENATGAGVTVRVIRDHEGFYYITAPNFKNVYVFKPGEGELKQQRRIEIGETAMADPKFNQRDTYIELLNGSASIRLNKGGIMEGDKK
jgi:hypothetical protein